MVVRIVDPICCMNTWQEGFHLWANLFKHLPNSHIVPTFLSLCTMRVRSHPIHTPKKSQRNDDICLFSALLYGRRVADNFLGCYAFFRQFFENISYLVQHKDKRFLRQKFVVKEKLLL